MMSAGINLVMMVIGFSVSVMFIVFVCARLVCARIQLNASRRSFPSASRFDLIMLERGLHGLEPGAVANFPTKKYRELCLTAQGDAQCIVCLSDYRGEDVLRILPYCGHSFHMNCIDLWLQQHSTCPICRISLRDLPERKRLMQPLFCSAVRSHYNMGSLPVHQYNCMLRGQGFPSRMPENNRSPIQDNNCATEVGGVEAGDNTARNNESIPAGKDSRNKHIESPSST